MRIEERVKSTSHSSLLTSHFSLLSSALLCVLRGERPGLGRRVGHGFGRDVMLVAAKFLPLKIQAEKGQGAKHEPA